MTDRPALDDALTHTAHEIADTISVLTDNLTSNLADRRNYGATYADTVLSAIERLTVMLTALASVHDLEPPSSRPAPLHAAGIALDLAGDDDDPEGVPA